MDNINIIGNIFIDDEDIVIAEIYNEFPIEANIFIDNEE